MKAPDISVPQAAKRPRASGLRDTLNETLQIEGAVAVALVDMRTGRCIRTGGKSTTQRIGAFASAATRVLHTQRGLLGRPMSAADSLEDVVVTFDSEYHLIHPVGTGERLFLYCTFEREKTNLALARRGVAQIALESPGLQHIWHWQAARS